MRGVLHAITVVLSLCILVACGLKDGEFEERYDQGLELAIQGEFLKAREQFRQCQHPVEDHLAVIEDVLTGKLADDAAVQLFKAIDYGHLGDQHRRLRALEKSLADSPGYPLALKERGQAFYRLHRYRRALADYDRALKADTTLANLHYYRAMAYIQLNEVEKAIKSFEFYLQASVEDNSEMIREAHRQLKRLIALRNGRYELV